MFNAYFTTERIMRKKIGLRGLCIFFVCQYIDFNQNISNHITSPGNNHPVVDWVIHIQPFQRVTKIKRLKRLNYSHKITYF